MYQVVFFILFDKMKFKNTQCDTRAQGLGLGTSPSPLRQNLTVLQGPAWQGQAFENKTLLSFLLKIEFFFGK